MSYTVTSKGEDMKKVISALLAVLMLVAFVSCDNQVVTDATADFFETYEQFDKYKSLVNGIYEGEHDLSKWNSETNAEQTEVYVINKIIQILLNGSNSTEDDATGYTYEITDASGRIKVTDSTDMEGKTGTYVVAEGVSISYSYTKGGDKVDGQLTFDCNMSEEFYKTDEDNISCITTIDTLVKNGFAYKSIKLDVDFVDGEEVVTNAVCDGITLDNNLIQEWLDEYK